MGGVERLADREGVGPFALTPPGSALARCIEVVDELLALRETLLERRTGCDDEPKGETAGVNTAERPPVITAASLRDLAPDLACVLACSDILVLTCALTYAAG